MAINLSKIGRKHIEAETLGINEIVHQIVVVRLVHAFAHVQDGVQGRVRVSIRPGLQNGKCLVDQPDDFPVVFMTDQPAQGPDNVPQHLLVYG